MINHQLKLTASLLLCLGAGLLGSVFSAPVIGTWYAQLNKPFFNPPGWIFGPVWTLLYVLMGISLYLVWTKPGARKKHPYAVKFFFTQLGLNVLWSIIFFGLQNPLAALLEILLLQVAILITARSFQSISHRASLLLYPYIAWVFFAALLNLSIVILN